MVNFCPHCGKKAEKEFKFCPYCGSKLPIEEIVESETSSQNEHNQQPAGGEKCNKRRSSGSPGAALKRKLNLTPEKEEIKIMESSPKTPKLSDMSPRSKKAKNVQVQPLPENSVLTDNSNTEWVLAKLLVQEKTGLYYEVHTLSGSDQTKYSVLKLDAKDGKIYNEQNFFQRAAKKTTVDKWKKLHDCPVLGIPICIGFGVHNNSYRFLVFSALGKNLQTIMSENDNQLREIAVYQILFRMIDVLEYVHENEYVHGDITAENIYVNADNCEVYLAGYYNAFRYSPSGNHVAYREGIRTPHDGTAEFISLDVHKGTGPSRRSDFESLGYCMLKWLSGSLPWSDEKNPRSIMDHKKRHKICTFFLWKWCSTWALLEGELSPWALKEAILRSAIGKISNKFTRTPQAVL
ncbi:serine/threonine-protein kinase VRK3 isoform X2 [Engystomops pustulosus]|uniref:serine/threonine-protein kinase VRK3 isoform X2 n=1 Tax=Engystomops pustulosus TaxID=76066 RepID=UPI003AFA9557